MGSSIAVARQPRCANDPVNGGWPVTLPVGLALFNAEEGVLWHLLAAAGIIIMVPMFVLALIIQKHFVQGMTMGAVR